MLVNNKNQTVVIRRTREAFAKNRHGEEIKLREEIEATFECLCNAFAKGPANIRQINAYKEKYDELEGQLVKLVC